jgi:tripartite-type tricarboxylate transporter receptor subunit TctC
MIAGFRMTRAFRRILMAVLLAVVGLAPFVPAEAAWPERTITIIVQFAPGGSNDLLGRILAAELAPALGQNVVVENRPGAAGNIGALAAARGGADGYTLKDFAPVAYLGASPNVILTRPNSGIASIAELIAKAKAEPGKINYATPGTGSVSHLSVEFLKLRAGIDIVHVPFSGAAPAAQAAIAGTTEIASVNISGMLGHVRSGALRALVQTGGARWSEMAEVPTLVEAGIRDAVLETTQFLLAPAGTPQPIIDRLADETLKALRKPQVRERMMNASFAVSGEGPQQLRERMEHEFATWKELIDKAGLRTN